ncbi:MAG: D,D-heptose 1,7-bisphosphate phosphatase [Gammaproteobacteria bacterium]|jgi:D-glycero-D-manno-heptose 1,7-bisphosphate phosphatase|nr:D,D-heptose 1,7-bisphosphate phosphatase [Gammaproteobacteria bacterium]
MNKVGLNIKPTAVIVDRDGVINADPHGYISTPEDWHALPGSLTAVAKLNALGIKVAVASNQSGIGRGFFDEKALQRITARMQACLAAEGGHFDFIAYCPHHPEEDCPCRKPKAGLLLQIGKALQISLNKHVWFVGDSEKDILAALAASCTPVLVKTGNGLRTLAVDRKEECPIFDDLAAVVRYIEGLE